MNTYQHTRTTHRHMHTQHTPCTLPHNTPKQMRQQQPKTNRTWSHPKPLACTQEMDNTVQCPDRDTTITATSPEGQGWVLDVGMSGVDMKAQLFNSAEGFVSKCWRGKGKVRGAWPSMLGTGMMQQTSAGRGGRQRCGRRGRARVQRGHPERVGYRQRHRGRLREVLGWL